MKYNGNNYTYQFKTLRYHSLKIPHNYNRIGDIFNYSKSPNSYSQLFTFSNDNDIVKSAR